MKYSPNCTAGGLTVDGDLTVEPEFLPWTALGGFTYSNRLSKRFTTLSVLSIWISKCMPSTASIDVHGKDLIPRVDYKFELGTPHRRFSHDFKLIFSLTDVHLPF